VATKVRHKYTARRFLDTFCPREAPPNWIEKYPVWRVGRDVWVYKDYTDDGYWVCERDDDGAVRTRWGVYRSLKAALRNALELNKPIRVGREPASTGLAEEFVVSAPLYSDGVFRVLMSRRYENPDGSVSGRSTVLFAPGSGGWDVGWAAVLNGPDAVPPLLDFVEDVVPTPFPAEKCETPVGTVVRATHRGWTRGTGKIIEIEEYEVVGTVKSVVYDSGLENEQWWLTVEYARRDGGVTTTCCGVTHSNWPERVN
jgi:hypothetical protein